MPLVFVEPTTARIFFANAAANSMAGGTLPRPQSAEDYLRLFDIRDLDDRPLRVEDVPAVRAARGEAVSGAQLRWYTSGGPKVITIHAARIPGDVRPPGDGADRLRRHHADEGRAGAAGGGRARAPGLPVDRRPRAEDPADVRAAEPARGRQRPAGQRRGGDDARLAARWQALGRQLGPLAGPGRSAAGRLAHHRRQDGADARALDLGELVREVVDRFARRPRSPARPSR